MLHTSFPPAGLHEDLRAHNELGTDFTIRVIRDDVIVEIRPRQEYNIVIGAEGIRLQFFDDVHDEFDDVPYSWNDVVSIDLPPFPAHSWVRNKFGELERLRRS